MEYVTTGSNNTVTNNKELDLSIKVIKEPFKPILITGSFTIEGLDKIAQGEALKKATCTLYGKTNDENNITTPIELCNLSYDANNPTKRSYIFPRSFKDEYNFIDLKISNAKCSIKALTETLKITFWDKNNINSLGDVVLNTINFRVQNEEEKPEIISFTANPTVLQGNNNSSTILEWSIKGENYSYVLKDGLETIHFGNSGTIEKQEFEIKSPRNGDHIYTLEVIQGNSTITKSVKIRALGRSDLLTDANPRKPLLIANFCVSHNSDYLFSLLLRESRNQAELDSIGYTNEGFSGNWSKFLLSEEDKDKLKPHVNAPMVHLKRVGELYGRLFLIGGSYVKPMECYNSVVIIDLEKPSEENKVRVIQDLPWPSRMGHSCTVYPHGTSDKIWLMGGVDEWGETQNDIWVSSNGEHWDNIDSKGSVNTDNNTPKPMTWKARCMAGVSLELDKNNAKKALWFGGGYSEIEGQETRDIWKWDNTKWTQIITTRYNRDKQKDEDIPLLVLEKPKNYLSSGLAFIGINNTETTEMYLLGLYKQNGVVKKYFNRIRSKNRNYDINELSTNAISDALETSSNSQIITAYFKGCLWYLILTDKGNNGIAYSQLFFWVPTITPKTLILS